MSVLTMQKIYHDPADTPAEGKYVLVAHGGTTRYRGRGATVEDAFRDYLKGDNWGTMEHVFRRIAPDYPERGTSVWEVDPPTRSNMAKSRHDLSKARLLGCYTHITVFEKTIAIDPALAKLYGVVEVYMRSDEYAVNFSYLDRTGMIRPIRLRVDSEYYERVQPDDLQAHIEGALEQVLEPLFQIPEASES